jgi:hypothetical protein
MVEGAEGAALGGLRDLAAIDAYAHGGSIRDSAARRAGT